MENLAPPPTDPLVRREPPFDWYRSPVVMPRRVETPGRLPDLDPDIALWPVTPLQRWPFPGAPSEGIWPKGWSGVDSNAVQWVCTVAGEPGTWAQVGGAGGIASWGQASTAQFVGSGSPVGVVTPSGEGDLYVDDTTPALWQATGVANTDWQQVGTSGQTFPSYTYGDGSAGPLAFTATPRTVTDALISNGSDIITSATADFTNADVGLVLSDTTDAGYGAISLGTRIKSVTNSTTAVMTAVANFNAPPNPLPDEVLIGAGFLVPGSYSSITIPTGSTARPVLAGNLNEQVGAVLCAGEYFINGTVDLSGQGAAINHGGTGSPNLSSLEGYWGPLSGTGGNSANATGGTGGTVYGTGSVQAQPVVVLSLIHSISQSGFVFGGGTPGAGDGSNNGGDGGNNGLGLAICAKSIVHGPDALYLLSGQPGHAASAGDCGGGGGGADGWWVTISDTLTGTPAITGGGGPGGAHSGTGTNTAATVTGDAPPTLPLTVVTGVNDQFVLDIGDSFSETFTMAPGTLTTVDQAVAAMAAATGSIGGELFSSRVTPSNAAGSILLTTVVTGSFANTFLLALGTQDVAAALGFTANPDVFAGATNAPTDGGTGQPGFGVHYTPSGVTIQTP